MERRSKVLMKTVMLRVTTAIKDDADGNDNSMEFMTEAKYGLREDGYSLIYDESDVSGMGKTKTAISIGRDLEVIIKRYGSNRMDMKYKKGESYNSVYSTEYGDFDICIETSNVELFEVGNNMKKLVLDYSMALGGISSSKNTVIIEVI